MDKFQRRKHKAHKRSLVVGSNQHGPFFDATAGGKKSLAKLGTAVDTQAARISDQENSRSQQSCIPSRADIPLIVLQLPSDQVGQDDGTRL